MSDLIDRQAAIDAICFICQGNDRKCSHYPCEEAEALMRIPTIEERKKGKWKEYPIAEDCCQCSECGILRMGASNYCPNCGADMRGDADEQMD